MEKKDLNSKGFWTISSRHYSKLSVDNIEKHEEKRGMLILKRAVTPMSSDYRLEIEESNELSPDNITFF